MPSIVVSPYSSVSYLIFLALSHLGNLRNENTPHNDSLSACSLILGGSSMRFSFGDVAIQVCRVMMMMLGETAHSRAPGLAARVGGVATTRATCPIRFTRSDRVDQIATG
eukprot:scaffold5891_cov84-Cylindrotheca_fusiformis.AAC.1